MTIIVVGCGDASPPPARAHVVVAHARFPVALTGDGHGGLLYAERLTGHVRRITRSGRLEPRPVASVEVSTAGQRGLLGVARDGDDRLFVAFTATGRERRIEVAEVRPTVRVIWLGPPSSTLANGGHLVYDPTRHRLVLGVGDLQDHAAVADPIAPNGKLLLLDPGGEPTQTPEVLSSGWNNPFAFTVTPTGRIWVADNVPGERGERLGRGDLDGRPTHVTRLPTDTVPSALTAPDPTTLLVCSFARARTLRYTVRSGRPVRAEGPGDDTRCRTGLASQDRVVWLASERAVRRLRTG